MSTFRCSVEVAIVATDGMAFGSKEIELPFVPFVGLRLVGITDDEREVVVERVYWGVLSGVFGLSVSDDGEVGFEETDETMEESKKSYGSGWTWEDSPLQEAHS